MHKYQKIVWTCCVSNHPYSNTIAKMLFLLAVFFIPASGMSVDANHMSDQELVNYLNTKQHFFKAELPTMSYEKFKSHLMDLKYMVEPERTERAQQLVMNEELPESFDAREKWPDCVSIKTIRDQANCGSCWAVSAASAMSDRLCVQSKGQDQRIISDADILSCCGEFCGHGCNGGYMLRAFLYGVNSGVCTGGAYKAKDCCKPYPFHPCGQHKDQPYYGECLKNEDTPTCRAQCQLGYKTEYDKDKIHAKSAYFVDKDEDAIRKEIFTNGPVQAGFIVYQDFRYYTKGVYVHTFGAQAGGHAIKIIGWGVENGVKYWLVSNSWNSDWGEDGLFKIRRGTNECQIESMVGAVIMDA
ncbi:unnamed protein product [Cylicocyclus nassatus]|uniref:Peptidase C1A papain C-terminal domain-containing protein n=1 Tax=Cylicocyclus nassatus TaxID=53992 RepID=A0AA36HBN0_CYLNA|nr:unnamed protein product [Cylicocyclus nassatus]